MEVYAVKNECTEKRLKKLIEFFTTGNTYFAIETAKDWVSDLMGTDNSTVSDTVPLYSLSEQPGSVPINLIIYPGTGDLLVSMVASARLTGTIDIPKKEEDIFINWLSFYQERNRLTGMSPLNFSGFRSVIKERLMDINSSKHQVLMADIKESGMVPVFEINTSTTGKKLFHFNVYDDFYLGSSLAVSLNKSDTYADYLRVHYSLDFIEGNSPEEDRWTITTKLEFIKCPGKTPIDLLSTNLVADLFNRSVENQLASLAHTSPVYFFEPDSKISLEITGRKQSPIFVIRADFDKGISVFGGIQLDRKFTEDLIKNCTVPVFRKFINKLLGLSNIELGEDAIRVGLTDACAFVWGKNIVIDLVVEKTPAHDPGIIITFVES